MARGPFEGCQPRRQHLPEPPPQDQEAAGPLCPPCSSTNLQTPVALSIRAPALADALPSKPTVVRKGSSRPQPGSWLRRVVRPGRGCAHTAPQAGARPQGPGVPRSGSVKSRAPRENHWPEDQLLAEAHREGPRAPTRGARTTPGPCLPARLPVLVA